MLKEYYELLGVSETATDEEIKNAYETLKAKYNAPVLALNVLELDQQMVDQIFANTAQKVHNTENGKTNSAEASELTSKFERLKSITREINGLNIDLFKFEDSGNIEKTTQRLEELEKEATELRLELQQKFNINSFEEIDEIAAKGKKALDDLIAKAEEAKAKLAKKIQLNIEVGSYDDELSRLHEKLVNLRESPPQIEKAVGEVEQALDRLDKAYTANTGDEVADRERLIQAEKDYHAALEKTIILINKQAREEKVKIKIDKLEDDKKVFQSKIDGWLKDNSAAAKKFGDRLKDLKKEAENADRVQLNHLEKEFKSIDAEAEKAGLRMQSFGDRFKTKFKQYASYLTVSEMFMYAEQALRSMFEQVKLIDSAMTELKKVTNESDSAYDQFLNRAGTRAKEIGTTIDGLVSSTADFARLGYSFTDAQGLAEVANIYAVVGDEIDGVEQATESLISTLAAFKGEMNGMSNTDFAMDIIDKFNEIGNNFAISSGGIGDALERSASSLQAANNTIDESIALITASNQVVQDPDRVGNALKTVSMRIRGAKTEMEEAGLETEGMVESVAKLQAEIKALSGVDIMLND